MILLNMLEKKIQKAKGKCVGIFFNEIPWAYKTTHKSYTKEKTFLLTYDTKCMIPVEIRCSNYRLSYNSPNKN